MHPVRNTLVPVQDVISRDPTVGGANAIGPSVTDVVTEYFLSQHISNLQPYGTYAHQDAYILIVILLPLHLLEPLLYVLELFTRLFI